MIRSCFPRDETRVMRLNTRLQHAWSIYSTIEKEYEQHNSSSRTRVLRREIPFQRRHIRKFPLTKVPRHFHNIELDARGRRTSYVQANNSPSMSFKGCLPVRRVVALQRSRSATCERPRQLNCICRALVECTYNHFFRERRIESSAPASRITRRATFPRA